MTTGTPKINASKTGGYVPSDRDFDGHNLKYPQRLLLPASAPGFRSASSGSMASSVSGSTKFHGLADSKAPRRVRPIPIAPPPGFETLDQVAPNGSSAPPEPKLQNHGAKPGYGQFVKMRAIAGCLDGDWSIKYVLRVTNTDS